MIAHAEKDRVHVRFPIDEPDAYILRLLELRDAERNYRAHATDLSTVELRPYADRLLAAQDDVHELFTEVYTIEQAERLQAALFKAITQAKASAGRFNGDTA